MGNKKSTFASPEEVAKFEQFLFEMDDVLDGFLTEARSCGFKLDFSLDSLGILEQFLLSKARLDARSRNRASRYLGEVFRQSVGGKWELCLEDPRYLYFGLPVISGYSAHQIEFCPIEMIRNFEEKREYGTLRAAVEAHSEFMS